MASSCGVKALLATGEPFDVDLTSEEVFPRNGSCVKCKKEETAEGDLQKCSGCKMSHYW